MRMFAYHSWLTRHAGLTIMETPKKNAKGKRVAKS